MLTLRQTHSHQSRAKRSVGQTLSSWYIRKIYCTQELYQVLLYYSIQEYVFCLTPSLSHNIRTQFLFLRLSNTGSSLSTYSLSSSTKRQYYLLVKKNCQILGIRSILVRQKKSSHLIASKPTSALQTYYSVQTCYILSFLISILYYKSTCDLSMQRNNSSP